jgi:hypothetical protein
LDDTQSIITVYRNKGDHGLPDNNLMIDSYIEQTYYIYAQHLLETLDIILELIVKTSGDNINSKYLDNIKTILWRYKE